MFCSRNCESRKHSITWEMNFSPKQSSMLLNNSRKWIFNSLTCSVLNNSNNLRQTIRVTVHSLILMTKLKNVWLCVHQWQTAVCSPAKRVTYSGSLTVWLQEHKLFLLTALHATSPRCGWISYTALSSDLGPIILKILAPYKPFTYLLTYPIASPGYATAHVISKLLQYGTIPMALTKLQHLDCSK